MINIDKYDEIGKKNIAKNKYVTGFVGDIDEKIEQINNLKFTKGLFYKITHPLKMIRNRYEYNRLVNVKSELKNIYDSNILLYIEEETGDLKDDLEYASRVVKPKYMENFVKHLKIR